MSHRDFSRPTPNIKIMVFNQAYINAKENKRSHQTLPYHMNRLFPTSGYVLILGCLCQAKKLPDYIKLCHANDPNLGECIEKHANEAMPTFIKEDKTFNLPSLSPFEVKLSAPSDKPFQFELDGKGVGLEAAEFRNITFKIQELVVRLKLYFPQIVVTGPFKIEGKILGEETKVDGIATVTFDNVCFDYEWAYVVRKKNGIDYMKTVTAAYTYEIKQSYITEETKGQVVEMNTPLNEIWKEIAKDVEPSLTKTIHNLARQAINAVTEYASLNEIFLP